MKRTPLYERHLEPGADMVDFGGWEMPLQYRAGIMQEHLARAGTPGSSTSPTWAVSSSAAAGPSPSSSAS